MIVELCNIIAERQKCRRAYQSSEGVRVWPGVSFHFIAPATLFIEASVIGANLIGGRRYCRLF